MLDCIVMVFDGCVFFSTGMLKLQDSCRNVDFINWDLFENLNLNNESDTWPFCNLIHDSELGRKQLINPSKKHITLLCHLLFSDKVGLNIYQVRFIQGNDAGQLILSVD